MDGSPQCGLLHATTLWHFDASERAPSTASKADIRAAKSHARSTPKADMCGALIDVGYGPNVTNSTNRKTTSRQFLRTAGITNPYVSCKSIGHYPTGAITFPKRADR